MSACISRRFRLFKFDLTFCAAGCFFGDFLQSSRTFGELSMNFGIKVLSLCYELILNAVNQYVDIKRNTGYCAVGRRV